MSLAFPASPTTGQIYQQWSWDGAKWVPVASATTRRLVLEVSQAADLTGLTAAAWNTIKYATEVTDVQNAYDPATGIFTPTQAGVYAVSICIGHAGAASGAFGIQIVKNGAMTVGESQSISTIPASATNFFMSISALIACNGTTDTIQARGFVPTGITVFRGGTTMGGACNMIAVLL